MMCRCGSTKHDYTQYPHVECRQCGQPSADCWLCVKCFYENAESGNYERNLPQTYMRGIIA